MKDSDIKVSIYCLAYNHGKYIRDTLEGFVRQKTNFGYEVIVHDDASTDNTADIIREYEQKYPGIIKPIYQTENRYSKGIGIVKNYIMPILKGQYIAVCEGDDCWTDSNKLQLQADVLDNDPAICACVHQTIALDCRTNKKKNMSPLKQDGIIDKKLIINGGSKAYHMSSIMYRSQYKDNRPDFCSRVKGVGDYPLSVYLCLKGDIYFINRIMSIYRLHSTNDAWISRNSSDARKIQILDDIISMLNMADEYSCKIYHDIFCEAIDYHRYLKKKISADKSIIKLPEYKRFFNEEKPIDKLKLYIKLFLPETAIGIIKKLKEKKQNGG